MENEKKSILRKVIIALSAIGPGLFMIGYNIGTGSITTLISAGSTHQMHLLWVLAIACLVTFIMLIAYQQYTLVTGETAMRAYRKHLPAGSILAVFIIAVMSIGEFVGIAGITGIVANIIKEWSKILFGGEGVSPLLVAVIIVIGSFIFLWNGKYTKFEKFLIFFVVLMGISFILSLFIVKNPSEIFTTLKPEIPESPEGGASALLLIASIAGTTAGAILYIMRSTVVSEKGWTINDLKQAKKDAFWSAFLMFVLSSTIMALATANTDGPVTKVVDMMYVLSSNKFVMSIFVVGVVSAGISTIFPIALILPWLISDFTGTKRDVKSPMYRILAGLALLTALMVPVFGGRPVAVLIFAGAIQVITLPIATIAIMILLNSKKLMGKYKAGMWMNIGLAVTLIYSVFTTYAGIVSSYEEVINFFK
jgi:Mn2+/Fe2+ NRAMP family transporter